MLEILKRLPWLMSILLVSTLCCAVLTLQLNFSEGVSDHFEQGEGPEPISGTAVPDYNADYCQHINQAGPGNPFSGWPAEDPALQNSGFITTYFCDPTYPFSWEHEGLDFGFYLDSAIVATADAYIIEAGWDDMLGNMVMLCTGEWCARYAHLNSLAVSVNDGTVSRGQVIGYVGTTGNSTGVHLHYDLFNSEGFWDPYPTLQ